jgi:hypothetical protein
LHSASSHIQSKILSAAPAASRLSNTTPKFPPADVQKLELSTPKKTKPNQKKPFLFSQECCTHTTPQIHTRFSITTAEIPSSTNPHSSSLAKIRIEKSQPKKKKTFAVGNQILTKSFFLRQIKPTRKQRAM